MPRRQLRASTEVYNTAIFAQPKKTWQRRVELLDSLCCAGLEPTTGSFLSAIRYNDGRDRARWDRSLFTLAEIKRSGLELVSGSYADTIRSFARMSPEMRPWQRALLLFQEYLKSGLPSDKTVYWSALCVCPAEAWRWAVGLLDSMYQLTLDPGTKQYTSAIAVCQEWRAVTKLLADMQRRGIQQDLICRSAVLHVLSRNSLWQRVFSDFDEMRLKERITNSETWNTVINACTATRDWNRALELWFEMQRKGVAPSWNTYSALLKVSESAQRWGWSRELMGTMDKLSAPRNVVMYNAAVNACRRSARWDLALQFLREMVIETVTPAALTYTYVVEACELAGRFDVAMRIMDE